MHRLLFLPLLDQLLASTLGNVIPCCVHGRDAAVVSVRVLRGPEHQQRIDLSSLAQLFLFLSLLGLLFHLCDD